MNTFGSDRFDSILRKLHITEGGYVNSPNDPGGETKFGISKRSYPHLDIKNLTKEQADKIYFDDFWMAMRCDQMPLGMDEFVMDFAVNSGVPTVKKKLQQALGVLPDGKIGAVTLAALKTANKKRIVRFLFVERAIIMASAKKNVFDENSHGWYARLFDQTMAFSEFV